MAILSSNRVSLKFGMKGMIEVMDTNDLGSLEGLNDSSER